MTPGRREALVLLGAGLAAGAAGFLVGPLILRRGKEGALPTASLPDLSGRSHQLLEWRGRVLVCNFWATWCAPCREEIPLLMSARGKYLTSGVEIVGIAIDNADKVAQFSTSINISYPILLAEANGLDLMRQLGNSGGGLPFTVFFDRVGQMESSKLGALTASDLERILGPMIRNSGPKSG